VLAAALVPRELANPPVLSAFVSRRARWRAGIDVSNPGSAHFGYESWTYSVLVYLAMSFSAKWRICSAGETFSQE